MFAVIPENKDRHKIILIYSDRVEGWFENKLCALAKIGPKTQEEAEEYCKKF